MRRRGTLVAAAGAVALLWTAAAAQRHTFPNATELKHGPHVSIERLTREETNAEEGLLYQQEGTPPAVAEKAEALLPRDHHVLSVRTAGVYHAVLGQKRPRRDGRPVVRQALWFATSRWSRLADVTGLPAPAADASYSIAVVPNAEGSTWFVSVTQGWPTRAYTTVGTVSPPEWRFAQAGACRGAISSAVWLGDRVIIGRWPTKDHQSSIIELDPRTRRVRSLYREPADQEGRAPIGSITLSPDGRSAAFGRQPYVPGVECGLWVLDLSSGACEKIVWDETGLLDCGPVRWDSATSVVFTHVTARGAGRREEWCRARVEGR